MADRKISAFTSADTLTAAELVPVVREGETDNFITSTGEIAGLAGGNSMLGFSSALGEFESASPDEEVNVYGPNGGAGLYGFQVGRVLRIHATLTVDGNGGDGCIKLYLRNNVDDYLDILANAGEVFGTLDGVVTVDAYIFYGVGGPASESTVGLQVTVTPTGAYGAPQKYAVAVPTPAISPEDLTFSLIVKFENTGSTVTAEAVSINLFAHHSDIPFYPPE